MGNFKANELKDLFKEKTSYCEERWGQGGILQAIEDLSDAVDALQKSGIAIEMSLELGNGVKVSDLGLYGNAVEAHGYMTIAQQVFLFGIGRRFDEPVKLLVSRDSVDPQNLSDSIQYSSYLWDEEKKWQSIQTFVVDKAARMQVLKDCDKTGALTKSKQRTSAISQRPVQKGSRVIRQGS